MRFTVFTPTYNRAYIIENLYKSLWRQSFTDFEWIVVDDGSTDDTSSLFEKISKENNAFPIKYKKVENGGKHRAINIGLQLAEGELFFIVDSDDYITDDALSVIDSVEKSIPSEEKHKFAGVCGLRGYSVDKIIGTTFEGEYLDITTLDRQKLHINGDKSEVYYTDILKKYPFPKFENERFVTECVVWDKISYDGYLLRFFNKITIVCNYLEDGLTAKYDKLLFDNPKGHGLYIYQSAKYKKIQGLIMWNEITKYYYAHRDEIPFTKIAKYLHMNPIKLWIRLFGIRLYHRLYDHWE